jgi:hypothetical protein
VLEGGGSRSGHARSARYFNGGGLPSGYRIGPGIPPTGGTEWRPPTATRLPRPRIAPLGLSALPHGPWKPLLGAPATGRRGLATHGIDHVIASSQTTAMNAPGELGSDHQSRRPSGGGTEGPIGPVIRKDDGCWDASTERCPRQVGRRTCVLCASSFSGPEGQLPPR